MPTEESRDFLAQRIKELEEELREANREIFRLRQNLTPPNPDWSRKRRAYPPDTPRDPETGRVIAYCSGCKKQGPIHARGLCEKCYKKWHYRTHTKQMKNRKLGGIPVKAESLRA